MSQPRIALVCDWLTTTGGAEKVLLELHRMYPSAPIYTSQYSEQGIDWFRDADVRTGWLQIFPKSWRKILGPLRQIYFSHLDLSTYDVVISVTGAEAKAVQTIKPAKKKTPSSNYSTHHDKSQYHKACHICYCHVPTQYYWQAYDQYIQDPGFGWLNFFVRFCFKIFVRPLRRADYKASQRPDQFVTISDYAADEIQKYYHREAQVVHPPVDVERFSTKLCTGLSTDSRQKSTASQELSTSIPQEKSQKCTELEEFSTSFPQVFHKKGQKSLSKFEYYIISCRQVTWKRVDLAISACLAAKKHLVVIGDGSEHQRLVKLANNSSLITFIPWLASGELAVFLQHAKAYIFPSLEPFGIAPVEALAAGCPVIAYAKGGSQDFIKPGINGVTFPRQDVNSLIKAFREFEQLKLQPKAIAATAQKFSGSHFRKAMQKLVKEGKHEIF